MPSILSDSVIESLSRPWTSHAREQAHDLAERFAHGMGVKLESATLGEGHFSFRLDLSSFYLRGLADPAPVLLIGGDVDKATRVVRDFWNEHGNRDAMPVFLFVSAEAHDRCRGQIPAGRRVVLEPGPFGELLESATARDEFHRIVREQISRLLLSPFNIIKPAFGNMFFGRQRELSRLMEDDGQSYVLAGPGRIGKSSLLLRYKNELIRNRDPRASRLHLISFYDCPNSDPDTVAQHLAFRIDDSKRTYDMTADRLVRFFRWRRHLDKGRLELLLDEIDGVCGSRAFQFLAQSAKDGDIRMVLCGRSAALLKLELSGDSNASLRLERLHPEPLDDGSAIALIRRPMHDLGIALQNEPAVLEHILRMTGRLPHLIQYYGKRLVERAAESHRYSVGMTDVEEVDASFETVNFFVAPVNELKDPKAKRVAKMILRWNPPGSFTCREAAAHVRTQDVALTTDQMFDLCNLLVMQNILMWRGDGFQIASAGLRCFSQRIGILDD